MKVARWGNSLAVRLPSSFVEEAGLKEGDEIQLRMVANKAVEIERKPTRQELLEGLRRFRGMMPADFKFDRDEANER